MTAPATHDAAWATRFQALAETHKATVAQLLVIKREALALRRKNEELLEERNAASRRARLHYESLKACQEELAEARDRLCRMGAVREDGRTPPMDILWRRYESAQAELLVLRERLRERGPCST